MRYEQYSESQLRLIRDLITIGMYRRRHHAILQAARDAGLPVTLIARITGYNHPYLYQITSGHEDNSHG